ncbi:ABC transporter ATP-binding protein [Desulfocicer niacini]
MILSVDGVHFSYPGRDVLKEISFSVCQGDCISILGKNGTGKSTLLKCLDRILTPQSGSVLIDGQDFRHLPGLHLAQKVGYIAQHQHPTHCTVFNAVLLGRKPYFKWDAGRQDLKIVDDILKATGLLPYAMRYLDELSGGELQKVVIARALCQQPRVLLMDEPTSNLDLKNQIDTTIIIKEIIGRQNISVVATMHDINLALRFSNKFMFMKNGRIFAAGGMEIITRENIGQVYGVEVDIHTWHGIPVVIPQ